MGAGLPLLGSVAPSLSRFTRSPLFFFRARNPIFDNYPVNDFVIKILSFEYFTLCSRSKCIEFFRVLVRSKTNKAKKNVFLETSSIAIRNDRAN